MNPFTLHVLRKGGQDFGSFHNQDLQIEYSIVAT
jgi:hypothetical protein